MILSQIFNPLRVVPRRLGIGGLVLLFSASTLPVAWSQDELPSTKKTASGDAAGQGMKPAAGELSVGRVRQELRKLDSDQLKDRDEAEKALIEMGPAVISFLPEITASTSGEMKIRLQRIRDALQKSNIGTFFEASLVTLSGKLKLAEALKAIEEQTGNKVTLDNAEGLGQFEVEIVADKTPFWDVMDQIMLQAKLRINAYGGEDAMSLIPDSNQDLPTGIEPFFDGPFRVDMVSSQVSLPYRSALGGQLDVSLQVSWEPRLKPIFLQLPMGELKATAAGGVEVKASNPAASPEVPINGGGNSTQIDLQLARPPRSAAELESLSGEVVIAVPSEKHKYVFEKFASGGRKSERFGEVTVTLENARRNGAVYEVRILTEFKDSQGALDSFRGWILSNRAYLLDEKENRYENVGLQTYSVSSEAVGVAFLFQINGDPNNYRLVYESPGMITRQKLSYKLEGIALP